MLTLILTFMSQGPERASLKHVVSCFTGRPPGPEMEYCTDRESYSLAAGLALGMVCLGVSAVLHSKAWGRHLCPETNDV